MNLTEKFFVCYAGCDEKMAREVVKAISHRLHAEYYLWSHNDIEDETDYIDSVVSPSIEKAEFILFLVTKEGSEERLLKEQFTIANNLNKRILPLIIEKNAINLGVLKIKSPFAFRTGTLSYNDESDRINLITQMFSWLGLPVVGDIYGSSVRLNVDHSVIIRRGQDTLGHARKGVPFEMTLSKGSHKITLQNIISDDEDWKEYFCEISDNDTEVDLSVSMTDVAEVRKNRIADQMINPENDKELNRDLESDTKILRLSRTSQDIKKRDVVLASFYRTYIESLQEEPKLTYTQYKLLPEEYIGYLCLALTFFIWGKAILWILAFILFVITFGNVNYAGSAWDWLWYDTSFSPIGWCIVIWIVYKVIVSIVVYVIQKHDQIRNNAKIEKVANFNNDLYNRLNSKQTKFLSERNWKLCLIQKYNYIYPKHKLTFDYSTLPDNSSNYDQESKMELSFTGEENGTKATAVRTTKSSGLGKTSFVVIILLVIGLCVYLGKSLTDEPNLKGTCTTLDNGNLLFTINDSVQFTMVKVNGGGYKMGSSSKQAWGYEKPVHNVVVSGFYIGQFEVTQQLWFAIMGFNPSHNQESLQNPVESVSWDDCQIFIQKLNELTNQNFRLPTEAEWEYAARGGGKSLNSKYSGGSILENVGWYKDNSDKKTHQVGLLKPNELGIYDMTGNVWEWVNDYHDYYPKQDQIDPTGPLSGDKKVHRGGSCENGLELSRLTIRAGGFPYNSHKTIGFRLAKPIIK